MFNDLRSVGLRMTREKPASPLRALLLLCLLAAAHHLHAEGPPLPLTPPPGAYPDTLSLTIHPSPGNAPPRYLFLQGAETRAPANSDWVTYRMPLTLSALPGERRVYRLELAGGGGQGEVYTYVIDRTLPQPPAASLSSGTYRGEIAVRLASKASKIIYGLDGALAEGGEPWKGDALELPPRADPYRLEAFSENEAGAKSAVQPWSYLVLPAARAPEAIPVVSPVPGSYANPQLLCLRSAGFAWIRYTLNGSDPAADGTAYTGPVLIDQTGEVTLRLAALPAALPAAAAAGGESVPAPTRPIESSISYRVVPEADGGIAAAGIPLAPTPGPLTVSLPEGIPLAYTFDERAPQAGDPHYSRPITLQAPAGGVEYLPFRFARVDKQGSFGPQYRYLAILDGRTPTAPRIGLEGGGEHLSRESRIDIRAPAYAAVRYTLDGTEPSAASPRYREPFVPSLAPGSSGELEVRAIALAPNGAQSPVAERRFAFSTVPPPAPEPTWERTPQGSVLQSLRTNPGTRLHYTLTLDGSTPAAPNAGSPEAAERLELALPWGMERLFTLRFIAVDRFGNLSPPTPPLRIEVDRRPPQAPRFVLADGSLLLEGRGEIYYNLTDNGVDPSMPGPSASRYRLPIPLRVTPGELTDYRVAAIAVDPFGVMSEVAFSGPIYVDGRPPALPALYGVSDGGLYNHPATLQLAPDPTLAIHYTFSDDGTSPPNPTTDSPLLSGGLSFAGKSGQVISYILRLLPVRNDAPGPIETLRFTVDRKPPALDPPTGFSEGGVYNRAVTVVDQSPGPNSALFISVARDGEPGDPLGPSGERFDGARTFDVAPGAKASFSFRLAARDRAGNTTELDTVYSFTVDKTPPAPPTATGLPPGGVTNAPVTLVLAGPGSRIFYRLTDDGSLPAPPDPSSPRYTEPISLPGAPDRSLTYTLAAITEDRGGNLSEAPSIFRVTVDRIVPPVPPPPFILSAPGRELATLSWPPLQGATLYYALAPSESLGPAPAGAAGAGSAPPGAVAAPPGAEAGAAAARQAPAPGSFQGYSGPIFARVPQGERRLTLWYFAQNAAGNRSPIERRSFALSSLSASPVVTGVTQDGLYNEAVTIARAPGVGTELLRYELASGPTGEPSPVPGEVSASSPLFADTLRLDVPLGATRVFALRFRLYTGSEDPVGVDGGGLRFTIDRTPPPSPVIGGIVDNARYRSPQRITLAAPQGDAIFCSVDRLGEAEPRYQRYAEPIILGTHQLPFEEYRISAYAVDGAGNRSLANAEATIFFDRGVVYVAPTGSDRGDGTSTDPYRTLARAIRAVAQGEQSGILLAAGTYAIESPISTSRNLQIAGGFDPKGWTRADGAGGTTTLRPSTTLSPAAPLVTVSGGTLVLDNLSLFDSRPAPATLRVTGGELRYEGGSLALEGSPASGPAHGVVQTAGSLVLRSTRWSAGGEGSLIDARGGAVTIEGATLEGTQSPGGSLLVSLDGVTHAAIEGSRIAPGAGRTTIAVRVLRSKLALTNSTVESGAGSISSTALSLSDSTLDAKGDTITGDAQARLAFGVQAQASTVTLDRTALAVRGRVGAVGLFLDGGSVQVEASTVRSFDSGEFLYPIRMIDATGLIANTLFLPGSSSDLVTVAARRSALRFINNTLIAGRGSERSIGILAEEAKGLLVANSILIAAGAAHAPEASTAIALAGPPPSGGQGAGSLSILANDFSGWGRLLVTAGADYRAVDALNGAPAGGAGPHARGNFSEEPAKTFRGSEDYRIRASSECADGGIPLTREEGASQTDRSEASAAVGASLPP